MHGLAKYEKQVAKYCQNILKLKLSNKRKVRKCMNTKGKTLLWRILCIFSKNEFMVKSGQNSIMNSVEKHITN